MLRSKSFAYESLTSLETVSSSSKVSLMASKYSIGSLSVRLFNFLAIFSLKIWSILEGYSSNANSRQPPKLSWVSSDGDCATY